MAIITSDYIPTYYPHVRHQFVWEDNQWHGEAGTCVANSLATILEVHNYRATNIDAWYCSWWIFGNRTYSGNFMYYEDAFNKLQNDGSFTTDDRNDNYWYDDFSGYKGARTRFLEAYSNRIHDAIVSRIASWEKTSVKRSYTEKVQRHIQNYGAVFLSMMTFDTFYNIDSNGIVPYVEFEEFDDNWWKNWWGSSPSNPPTQPPPTNPSGGERVYEGHSLVILGWKWVGNTLYWICQNSWDWDWGDNGYCYIPWDHGMLAYSDFYYPIPYNGSVPSSTRITGTYVATYSNYMSINWTHSARADRYYVNYRIKGSTDWIQYGTPITDNRVILEDLPRGYTYEIKIYAQNELGNNTPTIIELFNAVTVYPISTLTLTTSTTEKGVINASWSAAHNASHYAIEVYEGTIASGVPVFAEYNLTNRNKKITGLKEYTQYTVKVYGRAGTVNGTPKTATIRTADLTPPVVTILESSGKSSIYFTWSAYDSMTGLRQNDTYRVFIGTANGDVSTLKAIMYTNNTSHTFTKDGNGNNFINNAYYWIGVSAYDASGNSSQLATVRIKFEGGRPNNWSWTNTFISGNPINITASEWNSFTARINDFREYKGLNRYTFTTVNKGDVITASIVNQAINRINDMNPPISPPSTAVANVTTITAYFFNRLRDSLNSIP